MFDMVEKIGFLIPPETLRRDEQVGFAMLLIRISPSIEAGSPNPEIPTCFAGIANLLGMLKHSKFTLNVAFFVRHQNFLHPKLGNLQEVS